MDHDPAAQLTHNVDEEAITVLDIRPALHGTHEDAAAADQVPALQAVHTAAEEAP